MLREEVRRLGRREAGGEVRHQRWETVEVGTSQAAHFPATFSATLANTQHKKTTVRIL